MQPNELEKVLKDKINSAIATGLNRASDRALVDIKQNVAVRTGRLRDSYAVTKRATPEQLRSEVGSPLEYRMNQYPFQRKPRRNGETRKENPLFTGSGFERVVKTEVESAIIREFRL